MTVLEGKEKERGWFHECKNNQYIVIVLFDDKCLASNVYCKLYKFLTLDSPI